MSFTQEKTMKLKDFDYELPEELIAQIPEQKRENSKMMVLDKNANTIEHKHFYDITDYFDENDVLVLNNTKVIPARLYGKKETGANIEVFLLNHRRKNLAGAFEPLKARQGGDDNKNLRRTQRKGAYA